MSIRVLMIYEDRTRGGLHRVVRAIAQSKRRQAGRDPLHLIDLPRSGNGQLLAACKDYARYRFRAPDKAAHVFAVIDAYEAERVVPSAPAPPSATIGRQEFETYCTSLHQAVTGHMRTIALASISESARASELLRFHPHVLFWERESILLAGSVSLGSQLQLPAEDTTAESVRTIRHPTRTVVEAFRARGENYSKATDGPRLLGLIADDTARHGDLLARLPSLRQIVDDLAAL